MPKTFILSDESVNRYGFWVRTDGIKLDGFLQNPVMKFVHSDEVLPIGKWVNIRKENGQLLADAEFDENDAFALSIKAKVEAGYLKGASIGAEPIKTSVEPQWFKPGQTQATVLECDLYEVSICPVGVNQNAIALFAQGKKINLALGEKENPLPPFKQPPTMKEVLLTLGLPEGSSETAIVLAIMALQKKAESTDELTVELAVAKGLKTEGEKATYLSQVQKDPVQAKAVLLAAAKTPAGTPNSGQGHFDLAAYLQSQKDAGQPKQTFKELSLKNPARLMELANSTNPIDVAEFKAMYLAEFGCEPTQMTLKQ